TRIPRALVISEPYDSLSFVPTILALTNQLPPPAQISPAGFAGRPRPYPGRVINELFDFRQTLPAHPSTGAAVGAASGARSAAEATP
ncbi:MAG TPA: hypothetical protein VD835_10255, partial [Pyrinomonadaceae bacterium]|nr:hypothetical protein [Pyrinomonadaceae bacterium]